MVGICKMQYENYAARTGPVGVKAAVAVERK